VHGAEFVPYALRMGAKAILTDARGAEIAEALAGPLAVPVLVSDDPRRALAIAAAAGTPASPR
jgi:UDP-N-acetylmuramoyl-L-alanyl-D-glutamate--2,6-diaminopimelate ligase